MIEQTVTGLKTKDQNRVIPKHITDMGCSNHCRDPFASHIN